MSLDLDAIKKKLEALNRSTSDGPSVTNMIWKPNVGESKIRIVPYIHDKENPFLEVYSYFGIARYILTSPITYGDPCPIHEFVQKLKRSGNSEDYALAKKLEPKLRVYVPVLVRGEEDQGVKFWGFGTQVFTQLLTIMADDDFGDITDPATGRDITVRYERPEGAPAWQAKTTVLPRGKSTPMTDSPAVVNSIKNMPKCEDLFKAESYDELTEKLMAYINTSEGGLDDQDDEEDSTTGFTQIPTAKEEKKKSQSTLADVAANFNDMFNDL